MGAQVVLYIDPSRSECGSCGKNADPAEAAHVMERMVGEGCGAVYTHVASHYFGMPHLEARIREMRPDLEWVPSWVDA